MALECLVVSEVILEDVLSECECPIDIGVRRESKSEQGLERAMGERISSDVLGRTTGVFSSISNISPLSENVGMSPIQTINIFGFGNVSLFSEL